MTHETKEARALVDRLYTHGCYWAVGDTASENRARDCDLAADALTAALDRAEKAEAEVERRSRYIRNHTRF